MKRDNLTNFFFSRSKLTINIENFSRLFYIYFSLKLTTPSENIEAQNLIKRRKIGFGTSATNADSECYSWLSEKFKESLKKYIFTGIMMNSLCLDIFYIRVNPLYQIKTKENYFSIM